MPTALTGASPVPVALRRVDTGFSGSPALDARGRVIGLCVTMMAGGRCLLVGSDCLLERLERLRRA